MAEPNIDEIIAELKGIVGNASPTDDISDDKALKVLDLLMRHFQSVPGWGIGGGTLNRDALDQKIHEYAAASQDKSLSWDGFVNHVHLLNEYPKRILNSMRNMMLRGGSGYFQVKDGNVRWGSGTMNGDTLAEEEEAEQNSRRFQAEMLGQRRTLSREGDRFIILMAGFAIGLLANFLLSAENGEPIHILAVVNIVVLTVSALWTLILIYPFELYQSDFAYYWSQDGRSYRYLLERWRDQMPSRFKRLARLLLCIRLLSELDSAEVDTQKAVDFPAEERENLQRTAGPWQVERARTITHYSHIKVKDSTSGRIKSGDLERILYRTAWIIFSVGAIGSFALLGWHLVRLFPS